MKTKPSRTHKSLTTFKPFFKKLIEQYHDKQWLSSDPLQFAHNYDHPADQEVAAFIAACFAYGSAKLVCRAVLAILAPLGRHPAQFIKDYDGTHHWPGFYYRFHNESHVIVLIQLLQKILREYGSIGALFKHFWDQDRRALSQESESEGQACGSMLDGATQWLKIQAFNEAARLGQPHLTRGIKFFFNSPSDGSACKRMTMFLRWVVRHDELDLGLWPWFKTSDLVIPADTHVARIAFYLRLRGGKELQAPNWKMACEITRSLKQINPDDPVLYDFALSRLGILDICKRKYTQSICERCPVRPGCRFQLD